MQLGMEQMKQLSTEEVYNNYLESRSVIQAGNVQSNVTYRRPCAQSLSWQFSHRHLLLHQLARRNGEEACCLCGMQTVVVLCVLIDRFS